MLEHLVEKTSLYAISCNHFVFQYDNKILQEKISYLEFFSCITKLKVDLEGCNYRNIALQINTVSHEVIVQKWIHFFRLNWYLYNLNYFWARISPFSPNVNIRSFNGRSIELDLTFLFAIFIRYIVSFIQQLKMIIIQIRNLWRLHDAREKEIKGLKSYVVKYPF